MPTKKQTPPRPRSLAPAKIDPWLHIRSLVLDSVTSLHSKRAYRHGLDAFNTWCGTERAPAFSKATVQRYRAKLESDGLAPASINIQLSAIRKLALEAADNGLLAPDTASAIRACERGPNAMAPERATG